MPLGFRRWTDEHDVVHGRLEIGYFRRGLAPAYYEPVDPPGDPDRGPDIGIFIDPRGYKTPRPAPKGSSSNWSPNMDDVYWHPWAKPFPGEVAKKGKAELILQQQDLYDMWCWLMATDPDEVAERAGELNKPGLMRRWAFYNMAKGWKERDMARIAAKAKQMGREMKDVEPASEDEDEGFEMDEEEVIERMVEGKKRKRGDMGPPDRPAKKNKKAAKNGGFPGLGGQRRGAGRGFGAAKSQNTAGSLFVTPALMSGGRGSERYGYDGYGRRSLSVLNGQDHDDDDESEIFADMMDTRPPSSPTPSSREQSVRPGSISGAQRGSNGAGGLTTTDGIRQTTEIEPKTAVDFEKALNQAIAASKAAHEAELQSRGLDEWGRQYGQDHGLVARAAAARGSVPNGTGTGREDYNNGLNEEDALEHAIRASTAPAEAGDLFDTQVDRNSTILSLGEFAKKMRGSESQEQRGSGRAGSFVQNDGNHEAGGEGEGDGAQDGGDGVEGGAEEEGGQDEGGEGEGEDKGEDEDGESEGLGGEED